MLYFRFGLALCALAVIFGAFGAHALEKILSPDQLDSYLTGVRYQLIHGIVIFMLTLIFKGEKRINLPIKLMSLGVILFSCSIYLLLLFKYLSLSGIMILGPITPIGGGLIISSWLLLLFRSKALFKSV